MGYSLLPWADDYERPLDPPTESAPWGECECCGEPIFWYEDYINVDGTPYCMRCAVRRTAGDE